jgi:hypothetical protein
MDQRGNQSWTFQLLTYAHPQDKNTFKSVWNLISARALLLASPKPLCQEVTIQLLSSIIF